MSANSTKPPSFAEAHPFAPTGWDPKAKDDPIAAAERRQADAVSRHAQSMQQPALMSGDKNPDMMLAEIRRLRRQIDGASLSVDATCNLDGTITVTASITWGG